MNRMTDHRARTASEDSTRPSSPAKGIGSIKAARSNGGGGSGTPPASSDRRGGLRLRAKAGPEYNVYNLANRQREALVETIAWRDEHTLEMAGLDDLFTDCGSLAHGVAVRGERIRRKVKDMGVISVRDGIGLRNREALQVLLQAAQAKVDASLLPLLKKHTSLWLACLSSQSRLDLFVNTSLGWEQLGVRLRSSSPLHIGDLVPDMFFLLVPLSEDLADQMYEGDKQRGGKKAPLNWRMAFHVPYGKWRPKAASSAIRFGGDYVGCGVGRLMNHSCRPNLEWNKNTIREVLPGGVLRVRLRVLQPIEPGEELLVNYGSEYFGSSRETCRCPHTHLHQKSSSGSTDDAPIFKAEKLRPLPTIHRETGPPGDDCMIIDDDDDDDEANASDIEWLDTIHVIAKMRPKREPVVATVKAEPGAVTVVKLEPHESAVAQQIDQEVEASTTTARLSPVAASPRTTNDHSTPSRSPSPCEGDGASWDKTPTSKSLDTKNTTGSHPTPLQIPPIPRRGTNLAQGSDKTALSPGLGPAPVAVLSGRQPSSQAARSAEPHDRDYTQSRSSPTPPAKRLSGADVRTSSPDCPTPASQRTTGIRATTSEGRITQAPFSASQPLEPTIAHRANTSGTGDTGPRHAGSFRSSALPRPIQRPEFPLLGASESAATSLQSAKASAPVSAPQAKKDASITPKSNTAASNPAPVHFGFAKYAHFPIKPAPQVSPIDCASPPLSPPSLSLASTDTGTPPPATPVELTKRDASVERFHDPPRPPKLRRRCGSPGRSSLNILANDELSNLVENPGDAAAKALAQQKAESERLARIFLHMGKAVVDKTTAGTEEDPVMIDDSDEEDIPALQSMLETDQ